MLEYTGYVSLIQFCPSVARLEAVNVGVVLFCQELSFLQAKVADDERRPTRLFGKHEIDVNSLKAAKQAIASRLSASSPYRVETVEELRRFVATRGNSLRLTEPRSIRFDAPTQMLQELFDDLVAVTTELKTATLPSLKGIPPQVDETFQRLASHGRARLDVKLEVPILNAKLDIPYAYRNGMEKFVLPQDFTTMEKTALDRATRLAVEGNLIQKDASKRLIVLGMFDSSDKSAELQYRVQRLLQEYDVETVLPDHVQAFLDQVEQEAHG
jgi:hypothetical protein